MNDSSIKLLQVEDDPGDVRLVRKMLSQARNAAFDIETVDRLSRAVERLSAGGIDVVLLDLSLPDSRGHDTFHKLQEEFPEVPILLLTNLDEEEFPLQCIQAGAQDYLSKGQMDGHLLARSIRYAIQRKRMEMELRRSESKYRTLLENLPQKIFHKDKNSVYVSCNERYARDLKIELDDIKGKTDYEFYPKELADKYIADDKRVMESGKTEDIEERYIQDGQELVVHTVKSPIKDEKGNTTGVLGIFWDITERKRTEQALRESEGKLTAMLRSIGDHMSMMDQDLNIIWANETAEKLFGPDIIGKKCYKVYHRRKEPCEPHPCLTLKAFQDGKNHQHDTQVIDKDGKMRYFHCTAGVALRDEEGNPRGVIEVSRDITEPILAEKKLKESESKFRTLFENAGSGIFIADAETGRIVECNLQAEELIGCTRDEIIGMHHSELHPIGEEEKYKERFGLHVQKGHLVDFEGEVQHKDGRRIPVWIAAQRININNKNSILGLFTDITQLRQTKEALQESEETFRNITTSAQDAIIMMDNDGHILYWNEAAERIFGYTKEEAIGKELHAFLGPERYRDAYKKGFNRFKETGQGAAVGKTLELSAIRKDGTEFPIELSVSSVRTKGKWNAIGILRDITERKCAEKEVFRQSALLKAINKVFRETLTCDSDEDVARKCLAVAEELTGSKFGFVGELNHDGLFDTISISNPGWDACKMPDSEAARSIKNMKIRGIDRSTLREGKSRIVNDPASHHDRVGVPKGHPPITSFLGVPLKDGGKTIGMIGLANKESGYESADQEAIEALSVAFVEALKRKRAEGALKRSEASLVEAQRIAQLGNWDWDIVSDELHWSDEIYRIFGINPREFAANYDAFSEAVHPDDRELVQRAVNQAIYKHAPYSIDHRIIRPDGTERIVHEQGGVFFDDSGQPIRIIGTVHDITEKKAFERQLMQSSRLAGIGELAAGVAHEINNPIGFVTSNTNSLDKYFKRISQVLREYEELHVNKDTVSREDMVRRMEEIEALTNELKIERALKNADQIIKENIDGLNRVAKIVRDLKTFSHVSDERTDEVDINQLLDDVLNLVRNEIKYKAEVVKDYGDIQPISCFSSQLAQVFTNILINAAQAIEDQGLITVKTYEANGNAVVNIEDTGCGMTKETIKKIFNPFFTTKEAGRGTGLGLSITHQIIEKHKGDIRVKSQLGKGTSFQIRLPKN